MTAHIKPTIYEALSDMADPFDAAQELQAMANEIDRQAGKCGSTQLSSFQVMKVLGLNHVQEFRQLAAHGLKVYPAEGAWCVDSRDFRQWVERAVARIGRRPRHTSSATHQSAPELF